jgi:hypothetical protein
VTFSDAQLRNFEIYVHCWEDDQTPTGAGAYYIRQLLDAYRELVDVLREARREHDDDGCAMAHPEYSYNVGQPCTCGADAWNARVEAVLLACQDAPGTTNA